LPTKSAALSYILQRQNGRAVMIRIFLLFLPLLAPTPAATQAPVAGALVADAPVVVSIEVDPETGFPFAAPETEIVVPSLELDEGWIELTHLAVDELAPVVYDLGRRRPDDEPFSLRPPLPPGPTMLCGGGRPYGVLCEEVYRGRGELVSLPTIDVRFEPGLEVRGSYRQDLDPVAGARVAVVPAGLDALRAFTVPLGVREGRALREVATGADGRFAIPELAPGEYFLETLLPSGRVHRSDPFELPDRDALHRLYEVDEREAGELFWDLGRIDVPTGLDVAVRVLDGAGEPIRGAAVAASQGSTAREVLDFEGTSDADGRVVLRGLVVELPVRLSCQKEGFRPLAEDYELLPVDVDCVLEPWARVTGEVVGPDGQPPAGATVALSLVGDDGEPFAVGAGGPFELGEVAAGDYELGVAAPLFRTEERTFTLEAGAHLELGTVLLLHAREARARVVDAGTGEPIAGVDVRGVSPPGAVDAYSDLDGEFVFGAPGPEGLVLAFSVFDYAPREVTVTPEDVAADAPLVVGLQPAGWILAEVEDADGGACRGCRVVIWPSTPPRSPPRGPGGEELWSDGRGEALSGPLAAGTYRVARPGVVHLGSTVVEEPEAETFRVRVRPGRLSIVRLAAGGRTVRVRFEPPLDGLWTLSARTPLRVEKSLADDDGRFPVRQPPGESLDLYLNAWDGDLQREVTVWQRTLPAAALPEEVSVRLSGSAVHGRVLGPEGPLAGAEIRLLSFADASTRALTATYADGSFRIPHVAPGVYNFYVGQRPLQFISVGERQTLDLGTFQVF
jgi:hypothetical protein